MPDSDPESASALVVAGVLLAAGASRRLGHPKQLVPIDGESLIRRTARVALDAGCAPLVAVLGFEAERMAAELAGLPVTTVVNASWPSGMGASVACGVAAARRARPEMDGLLLLVCDQPRLSANHLRHLLRHHASGFNSVTASEYGGRAGVPAVFGRGLFPDLEKMDGDRGARDLILRHSAQTVPWPEGAYDIDLPEDLPRI